MVIYTMRRASLFLILALMSGCASWNSPSSDSKPLLDISDTLTGSLQTKAAVVEMNGKPAVLYASKDNRVTFQYDGQTHKLDHTARVPGGSRFQLYSVSDRLIATWWSHQDGKNLYSATSSDRGKTFSPTKEVNSANGVLPPYYILASSKGTLGAIYLDEREPGFQTYFNGSSDFGQSWGKPDQRLDISPLPPMPSRVQEPQAVAIGDVWFVAWADVEQTETGIGYRILGRRSEDAGQHWSPPVVIYRPKKFVSSLVMRSNGNTIAIALDELSLGIVAMISNDLGLNWRTTDFVKGSEFDSGAEGASNSGIDMSLKDASAYLVWMQDRAPSKTKIMRASLDTVAAKWKTSAQRLDTKEHDNTMSMIPTILVSDNGNIWTAWLDYRDMRPNIYVSVSRDRGESWTQPMSLFKPGDIFAGYPKLIPWGKEVAITYELYPTDRQKEGRIELKKFNLSEDGRVVPDLFSTIVKNPEEQKKILESRIEAFWKAKVSGDNEFAYDVFDFAFRSGTPKKTYLENVGTITYHSFKVESVTMNGAEAFVKMKVKYEVKPMTLPSGTPINIKPVEVELINTWVLVGDSWYLVYSPAVGVPLLRY